MVSELNGYDETMVTETHLFREGHELQICPIIMDRVKLFVVNITIWLLTREKIEHF